MHFRIKRHSFHVFLKQTIYFKEIDEILEKREGQSQHCTVAQNGTSFAVSESLYGSKIFPTNNGILLRLSTMTAKNG